MIPKEGRSGRFVIVTIQHDVYVEGEARAAIEEEQDYVMREAADAPASAPEGNSRTDRTARATASRTVIPDETLLFRYSAITFNPHRIHYDHPVCHPHEGYPALVVNGGIASILLLELFKSAAGRDPDVRHRTQRRAAVLRARASSERPRRRLRVAHVGGERRP